MSAGPATAHRPHVRPGRRTQAPRAPRRVSGPARGKQRTTSRALVHGSTVALPQPLAPRVLEGLRALPDSHWVDRLLRGRAWIFVIGFALIGLVFMQVSMLEMNAGVGRAVERTGTLERQNADLRATVSQLSSEERIQREAAGMGLVMPPAGEVHYLTSRGPKADAARAAKVMRAPSPQAQQTAAQGADLAASGALTTAATEAQTEPLPPPTPAAQQQAATTAAEQGVVLPQTQQQTAAPREQAQTPAPQQSSQPQQQAAPQQAPAPQPAPAATAATGAVVAPEAGQ